MKILRPNTNEIVKMDSTHFSTLHNVETIKPLASITHQLINPVAKQTNHLNCYLVEAQCPGCYDY